MFANAFIEIAEQLDLKLNTAPNINKFGELNFIAQYNNQFNESSKEKTIPKPAILVEFPDSQWTARGKKQQDSISVIRFHIANHNIADDNFYSADLATALEPDEYCDQVHAALTGFSAAGLGPLTRIRSSQDIDHDHIFVHIMEYECNVVDCAADLTQDYIDIVPELVVIPQVEIVPVEEDSPYIIPGVNC